MIDPERLRREFPALTPEDLEAYVEVTRRILGTPPARRAAATRGLMASARKARDKAARGEGLQGEESLLARYLPAVEKMQAGRGPRP